MQTALYQVTSLTIVISTLLILFFGGLLTWFLFYYQRKRFRHQNEMLQLKETFSQTLLQSKLEIQEETLDHIAKELHANFSHLVSLININLSVLLPNSNEEAKESILETKSLAKHLLGELKALSASLNTDHIIHIGFVEAFNNELNRMKKTRQYLVTFNKVGEESRFGPEVEIILFRLCQEVLNNIVKYSQATEVIASMIFTPERFKLSIRDNGVGFNMAEVDLKSAEKESTGFLNIHKRAKMVDAEIDIKSGVNLGTEVIISKPLKLV